MNEQSRSGLPLATSDSLELNEWYIEKWLWDFHSPRYRAILYFEDSAYQNIIQQARQDSNYVEYRGQDRKLRMYELYFEQYLSPSPQCSMEEPAYSYLFEYRSQYVYMVIIFCNRVYFTRGNIVLD